jgi:hypothetical protein
MGVETNHCVNCYLRQQAAEGESFATDWESACTGITRISISKWMSLKFSSVHGSDAVSMLARACRSRLPPTFSGIVRYRTPLQLEGDTSYSDYSHKPCVSLSGRCVDPLTYWAARCEKEMGGIRGRYDSSDGQRFLRGCRSFYANRKLRD